jgi:hypothetical protein
MEMALLLLWQFVTTMVRVLIRTTAPSALEMQIAYLAIALTVFVATMSVMVNARHALCHQVAFVACLLSSSWYLVGLMRECATPVISLVSVSHAQHRVALLCLDVAQKDRVCLAHVFSSLKPRTVLWRR